MTARRVPFDPMLLNRVEKHVMNSRARAWAQRRIEATLLEELGGRVDGGLCLEIGCGRGVGSEIIFERFGAREVQAFDLDPDMVARARKRLERYSSERLRLGVGSATKIEAPDGAYDAVFDFAILHHVPDWQRAVGEIARVLRPGGRFFYEEVTRQALERRSYRLLFEHPAENRFASVDRAAELARHRIVHERPPVERVFGDFVFGVGRKLEAW
jgi:ubiquinone/menaquinone biosynthesis C-methylase UbiE